MKSIVKHFIFSAIFMIASGLAACVITPNDHSKHSHQGDYNSWNSRSAHNQRSISERAQNACFKRMGPNSQIQQISDLKPGWFEVILLNPRTGHKAACTVNQQGHIDDWVKMRPAR